MKQRRCALILSCAPVLMALSSNATSAARVLSSSSIITTAAATGAVATPINGASDSAAAADPASSSSSSSSKTDLPIDQFYKELCLPPKSCTIKTSNDGNKKGSVSYCSYETLRGLSMTRQNMQARQKIITEQQSGSTTSASSEVMSAQNMHLSSVKMEEASVGCAILIHYHHNHGRDMGYNDPESMININFVETALKRAVRDSENKDNEKSSPAMICPDPSSCNVYPSENGKPACDDSHIVQLKSSRDDKEGFQGSSYTDGMARQAELDGVRAEIAAVGCVLMMHRQVEEKRVRGSATAKNMNMNMMTAQAGQSRSNNKQLDMILNPTLERILKEGEYFDHFLQQNYQKLTNTIEMEHLAKSYDGMQTKREKIELVLNIAGKEIPDIVWQERLSRERAVEKLKEQEGEAREQFMTMLQWRIDTGEININDLDTRKEDAIPDDKNVWHRIAEQMEQEELEKAQQGGHEAAELTAKEKEKEEKEGRARRKQIMQGSLNPDQNQNGSRAPPSSSPQECTASAGSESGESASSCTPDSTVLSSESQIMISKMKDDMELLRKKAEKAISEVERNSWLRSVKLMEDQIKEYLSGE